MRGDKNIASSGNGKNKCSTEVHDVPTDVPNYIKKSSIQNGCIYMLDG